MKTSLIILALATAISAPASAETLVHDGITYVYSVKQQGEFIIIRGEDATHHRPFDLKVGKVWIDGTVDGRSVAFRKSEVRRLDPAGALSEIASR